MKKLLLFLSILFLCNKSFATRTYSQNVCNAETEKTKAMNRLYNFFKSYDTAVLKAIFKVTTDEYNSESANNSNIQYMVNKNRELVGILSALNPQAYDPSEMNVNDDLIVFAGAIELYNEQKLRSLGSNYANVECIKTVILGFVDVVSLVEDYIELIKKGGTWASARSLIFRTLKRYVGWIGAANLIYEIATECF